MPLSSASPPGDLGGTAYADEKDRLVLEKLFKFRRARAGAYEVRLLPVASERPLPRDIQTFATALQARYPLGVLLVHEELRACFLFRSGRLPQLVSLGCAAHSLSSGNGVGFALLRNERVRWLSVSKNTRNVSAQAIGFHSQSCGAAGGCPRNR